MPTVILQVLCVLYIRGGANLDLNLSSAALLCHFIRLLLLIPTAVLNTRKVRELLLIYVACTGSRSLAHNNDSAGKVWR